MARLIAVRATELGEHINDLRLRVRAQDEGADTLAGLNQPVFNEQLLSLALGAFLDAWRANDPNRHLGLRHRGWRYARVYAVRRQRLRGGVSKGWHQGGWQDGRPSTISQVGSGF